MISDEFAISFDRTGDGSNRAVIALGGHYHVFQVHILMFSSRAIRFVAKTDEQNHFTLYIDISTPAVIIRRYT